MYVPSDSTPFQARVCNSLNTQAMMERCVEILCTFDTANKEGGQMLPVVNRESLNPSSV